MTMRSRGNWSVVYVRMVCVTTLPKCLVHIVSSLEDKEIYLIHFPPPNLFTLPACSFGNKHIFKPAIKTILKSDKVFVHIFSLGGVCFSDCSTKEKYTQLVALKTLKPILHFLIPSGRHAISIGTTDELVFLTRHPELIGQERISYSITKTELFKLTFQRGKRVAGSRSPAKLPVNVIILMNCYRLNANID